MRKFHFLVPYFLFFLISIISIGFLSIWGVLITGDDSVFLFNRIIEFIDANKYNNSYSNLYSFNSFDSIGSAVQNFYPNKILFIFQFFNSFLHNILLSYYLFLICILLIGLIIVFHSFLLFSKNRAQAFIFTLVFCLSNYQLWNVSYRFDIAEWAATFLIPLAFVTFYHIFKNNSLKASVLLGLTLGIILSIHVLSILTTSIVFALLLVIYLFIDRNHVLQKIIKLGFSYILMFLLNMSFVLNLFKLNTMIHKPTITAHPFDETISYAQLITNSISNNIGFSLGLLFIIVIILGIVTFKNMPPFYQVNFGIMVLLSIIISNIFPWTILNYTPLKVLQFSFRLLGINAVFVSLLVAYFFTYLGTKIHQKYKLSRYTLLSLSALLILFLQLSSQANAMIVRYHTSSPFVATSTLKNEPFGRRLVKNKDIESMTKYIDSLDYWPEKSVPFSKSIIAHQVLSYNNQAYLISHPKQQNNVVKVNVFSQKVNTNLDLPILNYNNQYTMLVNGKKTSYTSSKRGTIEFKTSTKIAHIQLIPKLTHLYNLLNIISLIIFLILSIILAVNYYFKNFKLKDNPK